MVLYISLKLNKNEAIAKANPIVDDLYISLKLNKN